MATNNTNRGVGAHDEPQSKRRRTEAVPTDTLLEMAMQSRWGEVIQRCETHPEDAKFIITNSNPNSSPTVLNYLAKAKPNAPYEVFEAVLNAFPAAAHVQPHVISSSPLHMVAIGLPSNQNLSEVFKLLVERCQKPTMETLESALPLPHHLIREHILPYVGNALLWRNYLGYTILHCMFTNEGHIPIEVLQMLLDAAPRLAAGVTISGNTALHLAVCVGAPTEHLELLIRYCPVALTTKNRENMTPLWTGMEREGGPCSLDYLKVLCGARPRAVLIRDHGNRLPRDFALERYGETSEEYAYLNGLTEEQQRVPFTDNERRSGLYA